MLLVIGKADPKLAELESKTARIWAAQEGYVELVQVLLEIGKATRNQWNGMVILHFQALQQGHEEAVQILLEIGKADPNFAETDSSTTLIWAAAEGYKDGTQMLLEHLLIQTFTIHPFPTLKALLQILPLQVGRRALVSKHLQNQSAVVLALRDQ